ncbi:hypothetical protein D3C87_1909250 [compost metagenome]
MHGLAHLIKLAQGGHALESIEADEGAHLPSQGAIGLLDRLAIQDAEFQVESGLNLAFAKELANEQ